MNERRSWQFKEVEKRMTEKTTALRDQEHQQSIQRQHLQRQRRTCHSIERFGDRVLGMVD